MNYTGIENIQIELDSQDKIWVVGQDLKMFDGRVWYYYDFTNSAVPSNYPYFLDTRSISIPPNDTKWVGCAQSDYPENTAVFYIDSNDVERGRSWTFEDIGQFDWPCEVSTIYASPFGGNDIYAFICPLNSNDKYDQGISDVTVQYARLSDYKNENGLFPASSTYSSPFTHVLFGTSSTGVIFSQIPYRTIDGGLSWTIAISGILNTTTSYFTAAASFSNVCVSFYYYNSSNRGLMYRSSDNFLTFSQVSVPFGSATDTCGAVVFRDVNRVIAFVTESTPTQIKVYSSSNSGSTFSFTYNLPYGYYLPNSACISTTDNTRIFLTANDIITGSPTNGRLIAYRTSDNSNSTLIATLNIPLYSVAMKGNFGICVGANGRIYRTTSGGLTSGSWSVLSQTVTTENLRSVKFSPSSGSNKVFIVGDNGVILVSTDNGATWGKYLKNFGNDRGDLDILCLHCESDTQFYAGGSHHFFSKNESYSGATGGLLYRYESSSEKWKEVIDGYRWPNVYDIKARGFAGNDFRYYLGTNVGLVEIEDGPLSSSELESGLTYIPSANIYNSSTVKGLGNSIFCLGFDENQNLWSGSKYGLLQYWDFTNWATFNLAGTNLSTGSVSPYAYDITSLVVGKNGHVFCSEYSSSFGIIHFNGVTASNYLYSTSSYNSQILSIGIQKSSRLEGATGYYSGDIWSINSSNKMNRLTYELPRIVASSKYAGATGWNFIYFNPATGGTGTSGNTYTLRKNVVDIPSVNKYSWEYPFWQSYQSTEIQYDLPGLDPRNLFLTTNLRDISSGKAGNQRYWDSSPIPDRSEIEKEEAVQIPDFSQIISNLDLSSVTDFKIYTTSILERGSNKKYIAGGYISGYSLGYENGPSGGVNIGRDLSGNSYYLTPSNPSYFASPYGLSGGNSFDYTYPPADTQSKTGFVAIYDSKGNVENVIKIPGKSTRVMEINVSDDNDSVYVVGSYTGFIENGYYFWSSLAGTSGPTGAPIGLTNSGVAGLTSDFSWIISTAGLTGYKASSNFNVSWTYRNSSSTTGTSSSFRTYLANGTTQPGTISSEFVKYFALGLSPSSGSWDPSIDLYSGMIMKVTRSSQSAYFRVDSIVTNLPRSPFTSSVTFVGVTYLSGGLSTSSNQAYIFDFYNWIEGYFPIMKEDSTNTSSLESEEGIFIMELIPDTPSYTSLRDLDSGLFIGVGSESNSFYLKYGVKKFRHFPALYSANPSAPNYLKSITSDSSESDIALAFSYDLTDPNISGNEISTLKNEWRREDDDQNAPQSLGNSSNAPYVIYGAIALDRSTFNLKYAGQLNTESTVGRINVSTLSYSNTIMLNGTTNGFNLNGFDFPWSVYAYAPFYAIVNYSDTSNIGVTGALIGDTGYGIDYFDSYNPNAATLGFGTKNKESYVYSTPIFGGTADQTYLGKSITLNDSVYYLVTSSITASNIVGNPVYGILPGNLKYITNHGFGSVLAGVTGSGYVSKPRVTDRNEIVCFVAGSTGFDNSYTPSSPITQYIVKQDTSTGRVTSLSMGDIRDYFGESSLSVSNSGDIIFSGSNSYLASGSTGPDWSNLVGTGPNSNKFIFISEQYVAPTGVNMGQIISRPGSNSWTWGDVHQSERGLEIPLMSTVFFSNYDSAIYGKQNNVWELSDSVTGEKYLNVKNTPYFIYTFVKAGYYTLYNSVSDSFGNTYSVSKKAFITVKNHTEKVANDPNPEVVNSADYGYPEPPKDRDSYIYSLEKEMVRDQAEYRKQNAVPFSSSLVIRDSSDATFNQ